MKALFCGLGSIGQRHLRNLLTLKGDDVDILAYRSRKGSTPVLNPDMTVRASNDALEETYNITSYYDLQEALDQKPDMVFITNPNSLHVPVALEAARAGCNLFIEKPIADTLDGTDELAQLVKEKNLVAFVAYQFRFHPGLQFIKQVLDEGKIGQPLAAHIVNGEYLPNWHPYEDYRQTHPARKELGGGSLSIQTHEIDYALWFFGLPKSVYAVGGHLSHLEVNVEDCVSVLMNCEYNNQTLPVHVHLDYVQRPPQRVCEIIGDYGTVKYDYYKNSIIHHDNRTSLVHELRLDNFDRNQMFLDTMQHFLDCVEGNKEPLIDLQQGIDSMKISIAALESLANNQVVNL